MRSIINFFVRFGTILLFLLFEGISLYLIVQYNENQKSIFNNTFLVIQGNVQERYQNALDYLSLRQQIDSLRKENAQLLQNQHYQLNIIQGESDSVFTKDTVPLYSFMPARVISNSLQFRHNNITIDIGEEQGVKAGMGVLADKGVVGLVRSTSSKYSSVLPIIHIQSSISAKVASTGYFGSLEWDGADNRFAILKAVPKHAVIQKGDTIVTSGYSTIFPPDRHIGIVRDINLPEGSNFYDIRVELFVDFGKLNTVYVIENLHREEIEEAEKEVGEYE
jgi:rod shape-determining protein MreC